MGKRSEDEAQKAKAHRIGEQLDALYPETPIPLHHHDAFTLLVAVMLSAQCTDERVNQVTPELFALARDPFAMAELSHERIRQTIRSLGLAPTKAKNLSALSKRLIDEHQGQVPSTLEELTALPGVGRKTASVVLSQWFGKPAFPVDTHIHRLAQRWGLSSGKNVRQTERDLCALFPKESWNRRHLQIIYFGREHCPARSHAPEGCLICSWASPQRLT